MSINKNELTKEQIAKAYMAELQDFDLDDENIKKITGGTNLTLKCPMKGY